MEKTIPIAIVGGVRPQFIKMAALDWAIKKYNPLSSNKFIPYYINTGQHYDDLLSSKVIRELGLHIDFSFKYSNNDPIAIMGDMFVQLSKTLDEIKPKVQWVVVMGDATTTFVGAVIGARKGYPVVHIEAGVRSGHLVSIEEMHRRIVSHISSVHFCTSRNGAKNLEKENINQNVFWSGDIAHDFILSCAKEYKDLLTAIGQDYIVVTLHKPTNLDTPETIKNIINVLSTYPRRSIFIAHPRTKEILVRLGITDSVGNITVLDSLPYYEMLAAIEKCAFIITDSGGLQREAYYLKKRCLVRRDSVGWTNFIDAGIHHLIDREKSDIVLGLDWAEKALRSEYPDIDVDFIRKDSWHYALDTLAGLS